MRCIIVQRRPFDLKAVPRQARIAKVNEDDAFERPRNHHVVWMKVSMIELKAGPTEGESLGNLTQNRGKSPVILTLGSTTNLFVERV